MQVAEISNYTEEVHELESTLESSSEIALSSVPKILSSPNTHSILTELPPLGKQQEYFAFGEGSRMFLESTQQDRSLQKWAWIFAG